MAQYGQGAPQPQGQPSQGGYQPSSYTAGGAGGYQPQSGAPTGAGFGAGAGVGGGLGGSPYGGAQAPQSRPPQSFGGPGGYPGSFPPQGFPSAGARYGGPGPQFATPSQQGRDQGQDYYSQPPTGGFGGPYGAPFGGQLPPNLPQGAFFDNDANMIKLPPRYVPFGEHSNFGQPQGAHGFNMPFTGSGASPQRQRAPPFSPAKLGAAGAGLGQFTQPQGPFGGPYGGPFGGPGPVGFGGFGGPSGYGGFPGQAGQGQQQGQPQSQQGGQPQGLGQGAQGLNQYGRVAGGAKAPGQDWTNLC